MEPALGTPGRKKSNRELLKSILKSAWLYRAGRLGLGVVFIWAGITKLGNVADFADIISAYDLVPQAWLGAAAVGLPVLEVVAGLGLALDMRGSLGIVFALLLLFISVLWFGILRDLDIDCGCFSAHDLAEQGTLRAAMFRDIAMAAIAVYLMWWRRTVRVRSARKSRFKRNNPYCGKEELQA